MIPGTDNIKEIARPFLEATLDSNAILDKGGNLLLASHIFLETFLAGKQLAGNPSLFDILPQNFSQQLATNLEDIKIHETTNSRLIGVDGKYYNCRFAPINVRKEKMAAILFCCQDITKEQDLSRPPSDNDAIWNANLTVTDQAHLQKGWKTCFNDVLPDLCQALAVSRIYIVEKEGEFIESINHEEAAHPPSQSYNWIFEDDSRIRELKKNKLINQQSVDLLDKPLLTANGLPIKSLLLIPIFFKDELWGIIGMDRLVDHKPFSLQQITGLRFMANILTMIIRNQRDRSERDRLATVVEQSGDCIIITSSNGHILYANQACESITGYSPLEIIDRNIKHIHTGPIRKDLWEQVKGPLMGGQKWQGQFTNYKKDHSLYEEEMQISPVHDTQGNVINQVIKKRNITEEKRLESIAEAANLMDNIGFIFSSIRHELGNPINSIKVSLSVLDSNLEAYEKTDIKRFIDRSLSDIVRVEYLLKTLKNFSIFERPDIEEVDLTALLSRFAELVKQDLSRKTVRLVINTSSQPLYGRIDPRAFQQVLLNLVTNAVDSLRDVRQKRISLSMFRDENKQINLILSDNGCGISQEEQQNLFKPFYTTKPKGTGLGLVIVKKMLAKMNCSIELHSRKGAGTQVVIIIPGAN
ncbi:MAG: PAS domain S-box protein [Thermodesulfobacteriota bacterium]